MPTSLGPAEIMVILIVALIVLGPKRLPEAGRQVGKAIAEVRKWSQGFQDEIRSVVDPDTSRPSYSQPQPGYQPPIPVIPAETPPPDTGPDLSPPAASDANQATTGDDGPVYQPEPYTPPGAEPIGPGLPDPDPPGPPVGEPPRT